MELTNPQDIDSAAQVIYDFLVAQGRATKDEIRRYCGDAEISTALYQKAFERLDRQFNLITEVANDDGKKSWAVKDWAKVLSFSQTIEMLSTVNGQTKQRETFGDWFEVRGTFTLSSPALASNPDPGDQSSRVFLRVNDNLLLLAGYYASMFKAACRLPGAPAIGNALYRVQWRETQMPASLIGITLRPVPPSRPGGSGQGVTACESLSGGVQVPFSAIVPGSHITSAEFEELLTLAGEFVGFSPAASRLGFGRFVPAMQVMSLNEPRQLRAAS